jgi:predicted metal-dependent TIM-barrel fold hydrolase
MKLIDPHIHMYSRTTDDYERMALSGVRAVVEPAFWLGAPRTHPATFFDYFNHLLTFERERAAGQGIRHFTCLALNPREANDPRVADEVLRRLPEFLSHPSVVAVGEIGFDTLTDAEERAIRRQVEIAIAAGLPILVHTPHRHKPEGTARTMRILEEMRVDPARVLIDHNTEETVGDVLAAGYWAGHTVYPVTKLSPERFVNIVRRHGVERVLVNSSADWGVADPLSVPKTVAALRAAGFPDPEIERVVWANPVGFFGASGRLGL